MGRAGASRSSQRYPSAPLLTAISDPKISTVEKAKFTLEALAEAIKTKTAVIEKKAKELEKNDGASAKERMLRGLFDKL